MKHPLLIGIGGTHSGAGKTTIAVAILKYLTTHPPIYPFTHSPKIGAIKYTKTAFYSSIIDDKTILCQEDKDTKRLLDAGAEEVLWVQSPTNELNEVLPMAIDRLSHLDGIIIEGNSAIELLKPDIVVFIADASKENIKPSARRILKQADIVIEKWSSHHSSKNIHELIHCIEMTAKKKEIEEVLKKSSVEGRITCSDARKIAEGLGVPYKEVGKIANELKIKIKDCELGCF
jgi:LAO/AO transport system kinase